MLHRTLAENVEVISPLMLASAAARSR